MAPALALLGGVIDLPPLTIALEQPARFATLDPATAWPSFVHWRQGSAVYDQADGYGLFAPGEGWR